MSAWTTERPTKAGCYWWRLFDGFTPRIIELYTINKILMVPFKNGEWQPVSPPQD